MTLKSLVYFGKLGLLGIVLVACSQDVKTPSPIRQGIFSSEPLWEMQVEGTIVSTIAANSELFFIRTSDHVIAYDIGSRDLLWSAKVSHGDMTITYPPVIEGEVLIVPDQSGTLAAFRTSDGEELWKECGICESYATIDSLTINNNSVYVTRQNDYLRAHNLITGAESWSSSGYVYRDLSQVVASGDKVIRTVANLITLYDASTGNELTQREFDEDIGHILVEDTILYMITASGSNREKISIKAYDFEKQSQLWSTSYESNRNRNLANTWLSKSGDSIYVAGGTALMALSADTGKVLWQKDVPDVLNRATVTSNGLIFARSDFDLYAFNQATGKQIGKLELKNQIGTYLRGAEFGPTVVSQTVLVPVGSNWVYAFELPDSESLDN